MLLAAWKLARLAALEPRVVEAHRQIADDNASLVGDLARLYRMTLKPKSIPDVPDTRGLHESSDSKNTNPPRDHVAYAYIRDSENGNTLTKLALFQMALERSFYRALHQLEHLREPKPV